MTLLHLRGKVSWFGGPSDTGVAPDEPLAFLELQDAPHLFLPYQPEGTTGLARRLNSYAVYYIACRWDYDETPPDMLLEKRALVRAVKTGLELLAFPADWGPGEQTGRICDLSPVMMNDLGIDTDDEVEVTFPYESGRPPIEGAA